MWRTYARIGHARSEHLAKETCEEMQAKTCSRRMRCGMDGVVRRVVSPKFMVSRLGNAQGVQAVIGRVSKQQNDVGKQFAHVGSVVEKTTM